VKLVDAARRMALRVCGVMAQILQHEEPWSGIRVGMLQPISSSLNEFAVWMKYLVLSRFV
jgi:hypothetical protein